jgi:hypothetical protein
MQITEQRLAESVEVVAVPNARWSNPGITVRASCEYRREE